MPSYRRGTGFDLPQITLTPDQKRKCEEIMTSGNRLLKQWATYYGPKKVKEFRNLILAGNKNPGGVIPEELLPQFHRDLPIILSIKVDRFIELSPANSEEIQPRTVEEAILSGFAALAAKHAHAWARSYSVSGLSLEDLLQEAYMAVIDAIYSYAPEGEYNAFSTFVWYTLRNRMARVLNEQGSRFCPLTNSDLDLVIRYDKTVNNSTEKVTFDQIVEAMGLSSEEGVYLSNILHNVVYHGDKDNYSEDGPGPDYTSIRAGIDNEPLETEKIDDKLDVETLFQKARLSKLETEVVQASMNPYWGWQSDIAAKSINPSTGLPYSKVWIKKILETALEKLRRAGGFPSLADRKTVATETDD
jgi:RNA polymerase sigma factor (sigma-70 family)